MLSCLHMVTWIRKKGRKRSDLRQAAKIFFFFEDWQLRFCCLVQDCGVHSIACFVFLLSPSPKQQASLVSHTPPPPIAIASYPNHHEFNASRNHCSQSFLTVPHTPQTMATLGSCGGHPSLQQEHGGCDEQARQDGLLKVARALPPPPSCSFLGSTVSSGVQMLSFSSNDAAGLGLSSGASMQGVLARVRGPFTPTQWMELEHQALIYKHFAANAPVPSSLLLPIRRSLHPWGTFGSSSLGWGPFRPGCADVEPGRCRRTDGKKWRCSRDAVGDQKYCERHVNRGRHRSRKHVEGREATRTIAEPAMAVPGGVLSRSHAVARQQQVKGSAANVTDPFSRQSNRKLLEKQNVVDQLSVSTPMDSFDFSSSYSSQNCDKVALSPLKLHHDHDQAYIAHGVGSSSEKGNKSQESRLPVSRETLDDGPLGEVFKSKSCQSASADISTDKWTESPKLHSPTGILQMTTKFSSESSSSTVNIGPAPENHITSNGYLTARMANSQTVPTLL